ncbi:hypothetical protein GV794_21620 [Nocardia cyriacigeorgica]|uniref:Mce-associated membrane protein n=1 Tax=Nocardia cyriacigeorgica TaxID=135487 RepID=A0A6P1DBG8_9NOCA|nr:hypothetical protein [Nocardia cyriacigeorgica]NEW38845.1 hypothetical protein [Nocardia cyriacigeorgica]NEW46554.1 hypothetical protein [Nocardia cyriacigeorgica]NEW53610.1 hypothetical protein [Nocardia cyriacigeorgica]NEW58229.1 hypothetical protein [Nocardia cyriacigeorgica]
MTEHSGSGATATIDKEAAPAPTAPTPEFQRPGTVSVQVSTIVRGAVIGVLAIAVVVFAALWFFARGDVADRDARASAEARAEQVATEYAVGAATVNYQDINGWVGSLKAGTTDQLSGKMDSTAPLLEKVLVPLKWTSTASPITAKVMSEDNGIYQVSVFVNVNSTNAQTPDGAQTTVTYSVTLDENADWKITDVGGVDGALPLK